MYCTSPPRFVSCSSTQEQTAGMVLPGSRITRPSRFDAACLLSRWSFACILPLTRSFWNDDAGVTAGHLDRCPASDEPQQVTRLLLM